MTMYVQRDAGTIIGAFIKSQAGYAEEALADDDAELVAFLATYATPTAQEREDAALARLDI